MFMILKVKCGFVQIKVLGLPNLYRGYLNLVNGLFDILI